MSQKEFTVQEVSQHNTENDLYTIIDNRVYDLTKFSKLHPGGKGVLLNVAGKDSTEEFFSLHRKDVLDQMGNKLQVGVIKGEKPQLQQPEISEIPYAESSYWMKGFQSPYYNEQHKNFRLSIRRIINEHIKPFASQWEENGAYPTKEIYEKLGSLGFWAAKMGPGPWLKQFPSIGGVQHNEFTYFHELIVLEEIAQLGYPGVHDAYGFILSLAIPPVYKFGSQELKEKIVHEVASGKKIICLAITDPTAGSDVANLTCEAKKTPCGQFYIVNGNKKWITTGMYSDYFVTAVRTGEQGMNGISLLLIERGEGVKTQQIKTSYSKCAGTSYVQFENVKVPVGNLLGKENQGFKCIVSNFNHERWMILVSANRFNRLVIEECFKWAHQRKVFGKSLISQPVIRNKMALMVSQTESVQNWIENITFQMNQMSYDEQSKYLAGPIALLKLQATRVSQFVSDQACQIFGGRAITRTGMGQVIERFQKTYKFSAIYGGSEEIMADLGIKQALKNYPKNSKL